MSLEFHVNKMDMPVGLNVMPYERKSSEFEKRKAHPIPSHDPICKTPFFPHLPYDSSKPFITRRTVLTLHPNFKHLDCESGREGSSDIDEHE